MKVYKVYRGHNITIIVPDWEIFRFSWFKIKSSRFTSEIHLHNKNKYFFINISVKLTRTFWTRIGWNIRKIIQKIKYIKYISDKIKIFFDVLQ